MQRRAPPKHLIFEHGQWSETLVLWGAHFIALIEERRELRKLRELSQRCPERLRDCVDAFALVCAGCALGVDAIQHIRKHRGEQRESLQRALWGKVLAAKARTRKREFDHSW